MPKLRNCLFQPQRKRSIKLNEYSGFVIFLFDLEPKRFFGLDFRLSSERPEFDPGMILFFFFLFVS